VDPSQAANAVASPDTEIWLTIITLLVGLVGVLITVIATLFIRIMNAGFKSLNESLATHVQDDERLKSRVNAIAQRVTKLDGGMENIT
jgi:hypothetical protein